jgi:hypothetical protein
MQWLVLSYFLSLGALSYNGQFLSPSGEIAIIAPAKTFQTTLGAELQAFDNHLFIGGSVQAWETFNGGTLLNPMESLYVFDAGLRWNGIEIGYRHECDHPILSSFSFDQSWLSNRDEFYLSFKGSTKLF